MLMMMPQLQKPPTTPRSTPLLPPKLGCSAILSSPSILHINLPPAARCHTKHYLSKRYNRIRASSKVHARTTPTTTGLDENNKTAVTVKAVVTVQEKVLSTDFWTAPLDALTDLSGRTFLLELVSAQLDPKTGSEKETIKGYAHKVNQKETIVTYESVLTIPAGFGDIGAVQIENEHRKEAYIKSIEITGFPDDTSVNVPCNSWTHSKYDNKQKRVFFTNKSYIPLETPSGIKRLREEELQLLRGNGEGERKASERIYDYDTYNDLGDPDSKDELARPVLGGKDHPYPRRCRTGRPRTKKDPLSEERSSSVYVPRDEAFAEIKQLTFNVNLLKSVLHGLLPRLESLIDPEQRFPNFTAIDSLFNEGFTLPKPAASGFFQSIFSRLVKEIINVQDYLLTPELIDRTHNFPASCLDHLLLFETPELIERDKFSWLRDEEFSRETLAGLNPYSIELVRELPLKSKLDPKIYGPVESLITKELVEKELGSSMTVNEALEGKKLFILDYHDLLMPYVNKVREVEGTTLYGSRTLFFLTENGTLRPIAIELTRPPVGDKPHRDQCKEVFTPCQGVWLWRLAKAHVCAHDSCYHQLVIHWLRTHCCTEPYIIAANRRLSEMHPIYRLLHPYFRYTMEINALARESLINAGGTIESCFSPAKYSIELSSAAYDQLWRFDMEALPADLIRRGMAVEDPTAEHGVKLTIEDYPFANDGLIMWDVIKEWVCDYVKHYYPDPTLVESDNELQEWWTEVRTKGHADKKDEPWWPVLKTPEDLIHILTTIIWVAAGHHAAVNFGQYPYAGYFPNRPTIARTDMPSHEDPNDDLFKKPEDALLRCFPSQIQATKVMGVLDVLSNHSPDEEYLGENLESSWAENPVIKAAFERFNRNLKKLEGIIDERNTNMNLKNRVGEGVVPYELLKPFSESGVTGKGVPNSISI